MRRTELVKHCLRNKNARRRGLGIEIALLVLLAAVALSALLVSTAMLERNSLRDSETVTLERLALDQIAEKYLFDGTEPDASTGYEIKTTATGFAVQSIAGELKLDVVIDDGGKVAGWTYHNLGIGG